MACGTGSCAGDISSATTDAGPSAYKVETRLSQVEISQVILIKSMTTRFIP
jgi:hypothetical protein